MKLNCTRCRASLRGSAGRNSCLFLTRPSFWSQVKNIFLGHVHGHGHGKNVSCLVTISPGQGQVFDPRSETFSCALLFLFCCCENESCRMAIFPWKDEVSYPRCLFFFFLFQENSSQLEHIVLFAWKNLVTFSWQCNLSWTLFHHSLLFFKQLTEMCSKTFLG